MDKELTTEYQKGFNQGYILGKHEPELYKALSKNMDTTSDYFRGMHAGKKQYDREVLLEMTKQAQQNKTKDRGLGM